MESKTTNEQMKAARELENASRLSDAAAIYQKLFNKDQADEQVVGRLLVLYRKLKEYRKELSVLNDAIAGYQRREKVAREKWIQSHPKAASAGKSILRQLAKSGGSMMGLGENHVVEKWIKRKELVTSRITGKKVKRYTNPGKTKMVSAPQKKARVVPLHNTKITDTRRQRQEAATARKKAAHEQKEVLAREKKEERVRKAAEAFRRKEEQEQRKAEAARQKAEANRQRAEAKAQPSLFLIILRYLVPTDEIDTVMQQHAAYLDKHYASGEFLVSGRQVPRTGGIILARAKNKNSVERIIMGDPFVKRKLASADIIEFKASQFGKGVEGWLRK